jgi:two-component system CheB/CheR fusion protein
LAQNNSNDAVNEFLVVGIGASAGGLEAFSELLSHLPADTGMAFVLVQHLSPDQDSLLEELLDRSTPIAVVRATDGVTVEANRVYVIPPATSMTIAAGRLQLAPSTAAAPRGRTVDAFLCSLAADRKNKAIAIVLSGSNDDGAAGIRAVREQGGITFAQDRATTQFREMPSAAIATGQVDFVLSPAQMAAELVNISRHPYVCEPPASDDEAERRYSDDELETIFALLRRHTGVDFAQYKRKTFERRMRRRMALNKLPDLQDYAEFLADHLEEVQALFQDALITVTNFFRDTAPFDSLKQDVFPQLLQQPSAKEAIRIWVAGCSTGEEVYSLAMCLLECLDAVSMSPTIQIFGTDVSDQAIEEARAGQYLAARMEGVSPERRQRFFSEVDGVFHINKSVRERCVFARHDLSHDPPFSGLDLVTCRNVLIYFQPALTAPGLRHLSLQLETPGTVAAGPVRIGAADLESVQGGG